MLGDGLFFPELVLSTKPQTNPNRGFKAQLDQVQQVHPDTGLHRAGHGSLHGGYQQQTWLWGSEGMEAT